jgi:hypothetical protein
MAKVEVDGDEKKGGVPSRFELKTKAGCSRQEGTPMTNVRTLPVGSWSATAALSSAR